VCVGGRKESRGSVYVRKQKIRTALNVLRFRAFLGRVATPGIVWKRMVRETRRRKGAGGALLEEGEGVAGP